MQFGVPVQSRTLVEVRRQLAIIRPFIAMNNPVTSKRTGHELGWQPKDATLPQDVDRADYFTLDETARMATPLMRRSHRVGKNDNGAGRVFHVLDVMVLQAVADFVVKQT